MFRTFLILIISISVAYWIGYHVGTSTNNYRPVCFLTYGKHDQKDKQAVSEMYWGYYDRPYSNRNDFVYFSTTLNGKSVYFLVERCTLIKDANGQQVVATINVGNYKKRANLYYLAHLFRSGTHILLIADDTKYESIEKPKNEEPGA